MKPEFEKQQGNVTVAALVCRARDFDTPRIFRKHSLEYMKKSESIGFALAILEEISKGVRCCTETFIKNVCRCHIEALLLSRPTKG